MAGSRPVRIARRPASEPVLSRTELPVASHWGEYRENHAGTIRASRLFLLFLIVLIVLYVLFLGLALSSPTPGVSANLGAIAGFTVIAFGLGLWGWTITLLRAPRSVRLRSTETIVTERTGRTRRFPAAAELTIRVVGRFPGGLLASEPTEMVEVWTQTQGKRNYLVRSGLFSPDHL